MPLRRNRDEGPRVLRGECAGWAVWSLAKGRTTETGPDRPGWTRLQSPTRRWGRSEPPVWKRMGRAGMVWPVRAGPVRAGLMRGGPGRASKSAGTRARPGLGLSRAGAAPRRAHCTPLAPRPPYSTRPCSFPIGEQVRIHSRNTHHTHGPPMHRLCVASQDRACARTRERAVPRTCACTSTCTRARAPARGRAGARKTPHITRMGASVLLAHSARDSAHALRAHIGMHVPTSVCACICVCVRARSVTSW